MNILATIFALSQAIGFKFQSLTERRLQEYGVSPMSTFLLQRYALIPALLWSVIFIHTKDLLYIIHTPILLSYIIFIAIVWNIQSFLSSYLLNTISSMSALATLQYLLYLPLLLLVGTFFNHDKPNVFSILSIIILLLAFIIQPTQHEKNIRARFSLPIIIIVGFSLLLALLSATNNGVTRQALEFLRPEVFLGVFSVTTLSICLIWSFFIPRSSEDIAILRKYRWLALAIPSLWFVASIPETYGYAKLPIYTLVSIGAITFAFDTVSDIYHKRIWLNFRTAIFIILALIGMSLAVYSV